MVNSLVLHKKHTDWGIGCISKELSKSYRVNFGKSDVKTCKKDTLNFINTDHCKTVSFREVKNRTYSNKSDLNIVIIGNEVKQYVGIGWVTLNVVTMDDLTKYPRVVE